MNTQNTEQKGSVVRRDGKWIYRAGYTNGGNGYQSTASDKLYELIPQMNALQLVISSQEWPWNEEIREQLILLSSKLACEAHELLEESHVDHLNEKAA